MRATFAGKNGKVHKIEFKEKKGNNKGNYKNVFVLTSNYTFSSAAILANALQYYKIGKIVGEETGGIKKFFGDNIIITLPNTRLHCTVSFKKFILPGASEISVIETVKPDHEIQNITAVSDEAILLNLNRQIED